MSQNYFKRPGYQDGAVDTYITDLKGKHSGLFNAAGRGYPDVSAQGEGVRTTQAGSTYSTTGTSASAPIFAAVIALVNDALIAKGKPPLGFLNPRLYAGGYKALTDVVGGHNGACDDGKPGFTAVKGWDAVTGWGTPDFKKLKAAALKQ
ncbi:uncharacterized protein LTR77_003313 [Saxophila tyrrhenica]|uniref:Peptidase S53 domain-containing protein n=1 Tax=Saxophila tyrrhenica TaxID=1690608 RepID=A0AAV9PHZ8_9PEZI|nr:hypothetical protein LTR77_003313 [Saxophila tyrrhenica]